MASTFRCFGYLRDYRALLFETSGNVDPVRLVGDRAGKVDITQVGEISVLTRGPRAAERRSQGFGSWWTRSRDFASSLGYSRRSANSEWLSDLVYYSEKPRHSSQGHEDEPLLPLSCRDVPDRARL